MENSKKNPSKNSFFIHKKPKTSSPLNFSAAPGAQNGEKKGKSDFFPGLRINKSGDEGSDLVLARVLHDFLVDDLVHDLETFDGFFLCDPHVGLLQGHGTETGEGKEPGERGIDGEISREK